MARQTVFTVDTILYNASEGARLFPAGETDPGGAWSDNPGGEPADKATTKQAMVDLIAAQDQIDGLGGQIARKDHDLAVIAKERDEANDKLADLEQRALAAEAAVATAEAAAADYMRERDSARDEAIRAQDGLKARVTEMETDVANANQNAADAKALAESYAADAKAAKDALAAAATPKAKKGDAAPAEPVAEPAPEPAADGAATEAAPAA